MTDTPWKTDNWHTSPWNFAPEVTVDWNFPEKIQIHDVTLRDGEQQAGLAFNFDDKIRIAEGLAEAGVHRIEASGHVWDQVSMFEVGDTVFEERHAGLVNSVISAISFMPVSSVREELSVRRSC